MVHQCGAAHGLKIAVLGYLLGVGALLALPRDARAGVSN